MLNQIHELQLRRKDLTEQLDREVGLTPLFMSLVIDLARVEEALDREIKAAAKRVAKAKARKEAEAQAQAMYSLEARAHLRGV